MSVMHIVWLKFNPGVSPARIDEHLAGLASLADTVPGIVRLTIGENFTDRAEGYSHGLIVELEDKAALPVYASHPCHVEVATPLREDAKLLVMDYEC